MWQSVVAASILSSYVLAPLFIKRVASLQSRTRNLVWQYFFAASFAFATSLAFGNGLNFFDIRVAVVAVIGAFNAFACYCHWRAVDVSLSKTSLFTQADDLTCLLLGFIILGEGKFLSLLLALGVILSFGSVSMFTAAKSKSLSESDNKGQLLKKLGIFRWILLYSFIWGVALFSMRFFALGGMSLVSFIAAWYGGAFVGAVVVFCLGGKKEAGQPLQPEQVRQVFSLSLIIWMSLQLAFWARSLVPIVVIQPIAQVSEMILPTAIGLWVFKERKNLKLIEKLAFVVGILGSLTIIFSF